jgi:hypothetical protein
VAENNKIFRKSFRIAAQLESYGEIPAPQTNKNIKKKKRFLYLVCEENSGSSGAGLSALFKLLQAVLFILAVLYQEFPSNSQNSLSERL